MREHSHKPIKQTRATWMAHAVHLRSGSSTHNYFPLGLWRECAPTETRRLSSWFRMVVYYCTLCTQGDTGLPGVAGLPGQKGDKGDQVRKLLLMLPDAFMFLVFIYGNAGVKWMLPMQSRLSRVRSITFNTHGSLLVTHNEEYWFLSRRVLSPDHLAFPSYK